MKRLVLLISTIAFIAQGCSKADINVQIPEGPADIVVEGYITPGYPAELTLTESNMLNGDLVLLAIWNAQVKINTDTGIMIAQNILDFNLLVISGEPFSAHGQTCRGLHKTVHQVVRFRTVIGNVCSGNLWPVRS